jgi:hypothetical protein
VRRCRNAAHLRWLKTNRGRSLETQESPDQYTVAILGMGQGGKTVMARQGYEGGWPRA